MTQAACERHHRRAGPRKLPVRLLLLGGGLWFLLAVLPGPTPGWAVLRDGEFIRNNARPYVAQAQATLKEYEQKLREGTGDRQHLLLELARVCCTLGELAEDRQRLAYYEQGTRYARRLLQEWPGSVGGRYWLALNLAGEAEVGGGGRALRLLPEIVELLEQVSAHDPAYDQAGAHRALGSIYGEAPAWPLSVGDLGKALHHLTLAVQLAPENSTNRLFLGYILLQLGRIEPAREELTRVFQATQHSFWPLGVEHDRREAKRLLATLPQADKRGG